MILNPKKISYKYGSDYNEPSACTKTAYSLLAKLVD